MNIQALKEQGYSLEVIRKFRRQNLLRKCLKFLFFIILFSIPIVYSANYFSKLPRERYARNFSFFKKFKTGFKKAFNSTWLTLSAFHEDPKNSELPIVELYIKGKRLDKLSEDLPLSGKDFQKASILLDKKEYKTLARFKGDSINHWAFPQKSWRITLAKDKDYEGMRSFNLNVPRVDTQISNWLGYELGKTLTTALSPEARMVHFRLNRKFDGVRLLLEQPDQEFLRRRNLPVGKIFIGDINSEQIYGNVPRKHIYKDSSAWEVRAPSENTSVDEVNELLRIIRDVHDPYEFYKQIEGILDIEATLQYMALLELIGSVHVDETHNGKFYFNPVSGKFIPIVWDTVAYMWKNNKSFDLASNSLFRVILSNPEFRERKDEYLWTFVNGDGSTETLQKLVASKADEVRRDVYAFPLKIHANDKGIKNISNEEWEAAIQNLIGTINKRNNTIKIRMERSSGSYNLKTSKDAKRAQLAINVDSHVGLKLEKISLDLDGADSTSKIYLTRRGVDDVRDFNAKLRLNQVYSPNKRGNLNIPISDRLFSKRRFKARAKAELVPATYVYEIRIEGPGKINRVKAVSAKNAITDNSVSLFESKQIEITKAHKKNSVWWQPKEFEFKKPYVISGVKEVKEDLILEAGQSLVVKAGSKVVMHPNTSILVSQAKIEIQGTATNPVTVTSKNQFLPWGVIALKSGEIFATNLNLIGGSEKTVKFASYTGSLSLHNSKGTISKSKFRDSLLSVKNSDLEITDSEYISILPNFIQAENAGIKIKNVKKLGRTPKHNIGLLSKKAFGTPKRVEREFKFSISGKGLDGKDLDWVSKEVNKSFKKAVKEEELWAVHEHVENKFYIDNQVKDFVFRDVYFDTDDLVNYRHSVSYRFRNRYPSLKSYEYHVKKPFWTEHWPYRLEYQAKFNRNEIGDGFSTVEEARFEFRKESSPFSLEKLPPSPPWDLGEFIPYFQDGRFKGLPTVPAQDVLKYLNGLYPKREEYEFKPKVVLLTERFRQHLNLKTPWGSGPNPEQAYIISIDNSKVFEANAYIEYLNAKKLGAKKLNRPEELGELTEIEIEFERNVSDSLDKEIRILEASKNIDQSKLSKLQAVRKAFLKDQALLLKIVKKHFAEKDIIVEPASKSKYVQASEL